MMDGILMFYTNIQVRVGNKHMKMEHECNTEFKTMER